MTESHPGASPNPTASPDVATLARLIRSARIDLSSERRAQADVEILLERSGIPFEREVRLTDEDIVDFLAAGVGIELKLRGARKKDVYRQLCRYARHPRVEALLLASNLSMGLPPLIEGKDAYFVKLGEAWL
jgi:hypothetical protein